MKVQQVAPSVAELTELYCQADWLKPSENLDLERSITCTSVWLQVKMQGRLAGLTRLQTDYVRYCCIYDLLVDKRWRCQGVGSALMTAAVAWCDQQQIQIVHLWPATGRIPFFQRFGFQPLSDKHPMMIRSCSYPMD